MFSFTCLTEINTLWEVYLIYFHLINTRELIVYNFRVMYLIGDKEIHIVAIYHTVEDFTKDMLNDRP